MKRLKVLHITSTRYGIGGVERLLLDMSDKFESDKYEFAYCNLFCEAGGEGVFPTELKNRGLRFFQIDGKRVSEIPMMTVDLARILRREKFDIIHLHMMKASIVGWIASRFCSSKTVITRHYTAALIAKHPAPMRWLDRKAISNVDRVIAISNFVKNDMIASGVESERITVVYNGLDLNAFDSSKVRSGTEKADMVIGSVGSLTKRKGHRFLIEAFAKVANDIPNVRLVIAGEGPEFGSLTSLVHSLDLASRVTFTGYSSNVPSLLSEFDLYVHPATDEPFGIAVLEAMSSGLCVIATAVDGVPEIIQDGQTGILVASQDPDQMASAMRRTLVAPDLRSRLGAMAIEEVSARFDILKTVDGYAAVYRSLIGLND